MAQKYTSKYFTNAQIDEVLNNAANGSIYLHYDDSGTKAYYRIFSVGAEENRNARCQAWLTARENDTMTDEIASYMIGYFEAPAPYSVALTFTSQQEVSIRSGATGNKIKYTFKVADSSGSEISDSIEVVYSFDNAGSKKSTKKIYNAGESVEFNVDDYISVGTNTVTMTVTARSTGATAIYILHYYVVQLDLTTTFNVAVPQSPQSALTVNYSLTTSATTTKYIEFYVDGTLKKTIPVTETSTEASADLDMPSSGKHHLQILAYVEIGETKFYSKTLYREFVVTGQTGYAILIHLDLDAGTVITADKQNLFITSEQYVQSDILWGYYNSDGTGKKVVWTLGGTSIRTTDAQVTDAESNAKAYTLSFIPEISGTLELKATVGGTETAYTLIVKVNQSGISKTTTGLSLEMMAVGRGNDESADERCIWKNSVSGSNIQAQFPTGWAWSERQGWVSKETTDPVTKITTVETALAISGGKQVVIPFAPFGNTPHTNGLTFEIDFETYDVDDETATVVSAWGTDENANQVGIKITAEGAVMQSSTGKQMKTQFKQNERIKLCFVINRVQSTTFPHLAFMMVDGVYERAFDYEETGRFSHSNNIILGDATGKASIKVYGIRVYRSNALTVQQEMYNAWIDSGKIAKKLAENDIYENGNVSVTKMMGIMPVMLFDGLDDVNNNITYLEGLTSKKDGNGKTYRINVNASYYDNADSTKNFKIQGARMTLQGTSSVGYPRKNFKLASKKDNAVMTDFEGKTITKGLWAFKDGDVPVNEWTLKADFMDSSCTRNASVARIFGDIEPTLGLKDSDGNDALKTPPQLAAQQYKSVTGIDFPYNLRTTPNGKAMVCFHKRPSDNQYTFLGQYTLLNDKGNEYVYGFHSIYVPTNSATEEEKAQILADPMAMWMKDSVKDALVANGHIRRLFDNNDVHCYEILDNVNEFSNFNTLTGWDGLTTDAEHPNFRVRNWEKGFESRYPEIDDGDYTNENERLAAIDAVGAPLKAFIQWMLSCYDATDDGTSAYMEVTKDGATKYFNLTRFNAQQSAHLNLYFCAAYYVYMIRFGAVDQVKKNMMWTTYGKRSSASTSDYSNLIWFPIRYDNDSTVDKRNDGTLFYSYKYTRADLDPSTQDAYYYSGHDSLLWNALEASSTFMSLVRQVDAEFYAKGLTYEQVLYYYDTLARDQWNESIYNENQHYKYISPLTRSTNKQNYLQFLQGTDKNHQHWWFRNRFDMYDAEWGTGEFANKNIHILTPNLPVGAKIGIVPSKTTKFGLIINTSQQIVGDNGAMNKTIERGETGYIVNNYGTLAIGDPIYILGANNIKELDLHELAPYITTYLEFDKIYDSELGSQIKVLKVGMESGTNPAAIGSLTGMQYMTRCEYLDMRGLAGVTDFSFLKSMVSLKTLLLERTGMTSFQCADGIAFTRLQLPADLRSINVSRVNWQTLNYTPAYTLTNVTLGYMNDETEYANVKTFVFAWLDMLETKYGIAVKWSSYMLNLTGVDWTNVPYHRLEQLMNLGSCQMSGHSYIKCSTEFTSAQMTELLTAFGANIFTPGSDLVIDCNSTNLVIGIEGDVTTDADGVIVLVETHTAKAVATGFGNLKTGGSSNVQYRIKESSTYGVSINETTGIITSLERGNNQHELTISAYNTSSLAQGEVTLRIKPLTYPTAVSIYRVLDHNDNEVEIADGAVNITESGAYRFYPQFTPQTYSGSIKQSTWTYSGTDASKSALTQQSNLMATLQIDDVSGETAETLYANYVFNNIAKDPSSIGITTPSLTINMFSDTNILYNLDTIGGNEALYAVMLQYIPNPKTPNVMSSSELRNPTQVTVSASSGVVNFTSMTYNVLDYLKNVITLTCTGCSTLTGNVDITKMSNLAVLDLNGTSTVNVVGMANKPNITSVKMHCPTKVTMSNCPNLALSAASNDDNSEISEVDLNDNNRTDMLAFIADVVISQKNS